MAKAATVAISDLRAIRRPKSSTLNDVAPQVSTVAASESLLNPVSTITTSVKTTPNICSIPNANRSRCLQTGEWLGVSDGAKARVCLMADPSSRECSSN